jgi:1-acyl-sn-glycerol-3-phosphate acyltransferase
MPTWQYNSAPDYGTTWLQRLRRFPRSPDMTAWGLRSFSAFIIRTYLRLFHCLKVEGADHLVQPESFAFVANHASHLDALCLLAALPGSHVHRAFPAAAADYWYQTPIGTVIASGMLNALAMERKGNPRRSLEGCRKVLAEPGNVLILFPEGRRSPDGRLLPFKSGIGFLLAGTNYLVVPAYISGTERALPRGRLLPVPHPIHIKVGPPRRFAHLPADRTGYDEVARELATVIRDLGPRSGSPGPKSPSDQPPA